VESVFILIVAGMITFDHKQKKLDLDCPFWNFDTSANRLTPMVLVTKIALMLAKRKTVEEVRFRNCVSPDNISLSNFQKSAFNTSNLVSW